MYKFNMNTEITKLADISDIRRENLRQLEKEAGGRKYLAEKMDVAYSQITNVLSPNPSRNIGPNMARLAEKAMQKPSGWMDQPHDNSGVPASNARLADFAVGIADDSNSNEWFEIPYYYAKGACGNGSDNPTDEIKGHLRKEKSWLKKYGVKEKNLFVVYADGDSNADFIVDGDMVIFDKSKTEPEDGEMFFIKHPAGDRIKTLKRKANGNWLICSRNHDKLRYPDEEITEEEAQQIEILGRYVYRQG